MRCSQNSSQYSSQGVLLTQINKFESKSSKSSISQQQKMKMLNSDESSQFSFCKGSLDQGKSSIREDLFKLDKQHLIQLLLEEIQQSKILRIKLATMQEQCKIIQSFRGEAPEKMDSGEFVSISKYQQLANYMQQYISNTNEAQNYFSSTIQQLKSNNLVLQKQKKSLQQKIKSLQQCALSNNDQAKIQEQEQIIKNLQNSLTQYMNINNQNARKYEKLKKMYDLLQQQLSMALDSYRNNKDDSLDNISQYGALKERVNQKENYEFQLKQGKHEIKQLVEAKQKIKILEINNHQLKQAYSQMQKALQGKSDKIRKLLEQMQKLSEQKWIYKQKYMELKSKSYTLTQSSSSKNSIYDSYAHVPQFQSNFKS